MKPSLLIVGLGNPGAEYAQTRHNVGWMILDAFLATQDHSAWKESGTLSLSTFTTANGETIAAVKPQSFMNLSGEALAPYLSYFKIDPASLLVITDDIDLPLGTIRFRESGGAGTHNGLRSLCSHCGEGFARLRIGIGMSTAGADLASYVLSSFTQEEREKIRACTPDTLKKISAWIAAQ